MDRIDASALSTTRNTALDGPNAITAPGSTANASIDMPPNHIASVTPAPIMMRLASLVHVIVIGMLKFRALLFHLADKVRQRRHLDI